LIFNPPIANKHVEDEHKFFPDDVHWQDIRPDLIISANFTQLLQPATQQYGRDALYVFPAFTSKPRDIVSTTMPFTLYPGVNKIAMITRKFRQRLTPVWIAAWGLFDVS